MLMLPVQRALVGSWLTRAVIKSALMCRVWVLDFLLAGIGL